MLHLDARHALLVPRGVTSIIIFSIAILAGALLFSGCDDGSVTEEVSPGVARARARSRQGDADAGGDHAGHAHAGSGEADGADPHAGLPPGHAQGAAPGRAPEAPIVWTVPEGWVQEPPASSMRMAQYRLPAASEDEVDVTVAFFAGIAGSVDANIDRWLGQMAQPDGRPSREVAHIERFESEGGVPITFLDVTGTFTSDMQPGGGGGAAAGGGGSNSRMLAAVLETPAGTPQLKLVGPAASVARWHDSVLACLRSVRLR